MKKLTKYDFSKENIVSYGNMFLLGNGHIGYRGTLEEYSKEENAGLVVNGFFDRYEDKWREPVNMPIPFFIRVKNEFEKCSVLDTEPFFHKITLDIERAIFKRETKFKTLEIKSERFIHYRDENALYLKYEICAKEAQNVELSVGIDKNIWEINGPHFKETRFVINDNQINFYGLTNENKIISESAVYLFEGFEVEQKENYFLLKTRLSENEKRVIYVKTLIFEHEHNYKKVRFSKNEYLQKRREHSRLFRTDFLNARVTIKGDRLAQDQLDYSLYHLQILANPNYELSIPARGVSGQTYKGAIFWDTEIFLVPYFLLTNPVIAKNCLLYRINTLEGAKENARNNGYEGAFYPWESQEGKEVCSKYNVTDAITGEPIRTYFNEKQIHSTAAIVSAITKYLALTNDMEMLNEKTKETLIECIKFYMSYGKRLEDGKIHFFDVIGPDEYHERINDNAYTNYSIFNASREALNLLSNGDYFYEELRNFKNDIYLIEPRNDGVIEQFAGYFALEDVLPEELKKRLRHPHEYWGGERGVANKTRVIKQADVIAMLVLHREHFKKEIKRANFDFYLPYTEHGSSLSAPFYSMCASEIGEKDFAYEMFLKCSGIDLGTDQKMYAGGIYIGGTHPASNAGAYLSTVYGFCGLEFKDNKPVVNPRLPKRWQEVSFKISYRGQKYQIKIDKNGHRVEKL